MCHQMLRGEYNIYYVLSPLSQAIGMCGKHCSLVWEYYAKLQYNYFMESFFFFFIKTELWELLWLDHSCTSL